MIFKFQAVLKILQTGKDYSKVKRKIVTRRLIHERGEANEEFFDSRN